MARADHPEGAGTIARDLERKLRAGGPGPTRRMAPRARGRGARTPTSPAGIRRPCGTVRRARRPTGGRSTPRP